jgi:hypothetical protein
MKITFEIDDALVPSIDQFLATQIRVENDPVTNSQTMVRLHADVESFLEDALHQVVDQTVRRFPPPYIREQMVAAQAINTQIKESLRPKRVKE